MSGLIVLFTVTVQYGYRVLKEIAIWFERNTRFLDRGHKLLWVLGAVALGIGIGQYLWGNPQLQSLHWVVDQLQIWARYLFLGGLKLVLPPLVLCAIYLNVRESHGSVLPLKASAFFLFTTLFAVSFGFLSGIFVNAGEGLVLVESELEKGEPGQNWLPWSHNLLGMVIGGIVIAYVLTDTAKEIAEKFDFLAKWAYEKTLWWLEFMLRFLAPALLLMLTGMIAGSNEGLKEFTGPLWTVMKGGMMGMGLHALFVILLTAVIIKSISREASFVRTIAPAVGWIGILRSSVAGLKYSMPAAEKFGISKKHREFVLPFGATVNMDGTSVWLATASVAFLTCVGVDLSFTNAAIFVIWGSLLYTILTVSVGTAAAPSASIVLMESVLLSAANAAGVEVSTGQVAGLIVLLITIDQVMDMFRTALNVFGDLHCTLVLEDTAKREATAA